MLCRVLVIESAESPLFLHLQALLGWHGEIVCDRCGWGDVGPQQVVGHNAGLFLALAVPEPSEATSVFRWLRERQGGQASFAVLPSGCRGALLREAAGAVDDFVLWPARPVELQSRLARVWSPTALTGEGELAPLTGSPGMSPLVGRDPAFRELVRKLACVAATDVPVLLTGETGTGKELCARALHHLSDRRAGPFIPVDCGGLPDTLLDSELFGHVRGAFTDAHREQHGLVAMADEGTMFLDEVDTLSAGAQATLLRVLEEGTYRPLGAERFAHANVRVVSATNVDLDRAVRDGRFRADLFFRLAGVRLRVPPLRERHADVGLLAEHFLTLHQAASGRARRTLTPDALRKLERYDWPGNVRELSNAIRIAVLFSPGTQVRPQDLDVAASAEPPPTPTLRAARAAVVGRFERQYLEALLRRHGGNLTHASRVAGQDRRALGRLIAKHGLDPRRFH